jgi:hypothetical protein
MKVGETEKFWRASVDVFVIMCRAYLTVRFEFFVTESTAPRVK